MNKESIIRSLASDFMEREMEMCENAYNGHDRFMLKLKPELGKIYAIEDKVIFLDEIKQSLKVWENRQVGTQYLTGMRSILYEKIEFLVNQEFEVLPKIVHTGYQERKLNVDKGFVCYARKDRDFVDDMSRHLRPISDKITMWDDSKIRPGTDWEKEIESALDGFSVAVLLISADFLNSEFIMQIELPAILKAEAERKITVIPVYIKPCYHEKFPEITRLQGINDPKFPISSMELNDIENQWVNLAREIDRILKGNP